MAKTVIGDLVWRVKADTTQYDRASKKVETNTGKMSAGFKATAIGIAAVAVAAVVNVTKASVEAASAAEEVANKFNVTFSMISDEAAEAATNLSESFGLSRRAGQELLANTGDLLTGFGFTQSAALDLSTQVNELAVDLASFTNFSGGAQGASEALTKGLLGERESMKALGIAIMEADIQQLAEDKGIVGELDRQTKAQLTLELALRQSKNAIGDFARSADSYANRIRVAQAASEDLKAELGRALLPTATEAVGIWGNLTNAIADYVKARNDAKDVERAANGEIETTAELLEVARSRVKELQGDLSIYTDAIDTTASIELEYLQEEIRLQQGVVRNLENRLSGQKIYQAQLQQTADALNAQTEAEKKATEELEAYIELVNSEYAKTTEGQIEALQEEVALWEQYLEVAVATKPEIQAILDLKKEQLEDLQSETDVLQLVNALRGDTYTEEIERQKALYEEKERLRQEDLAREAAAQQQIIDTTFAAAGQISSILGSINQLQENNNDKELARLQERVDATEEGTEERARAEEEFDARKKQLQKDEAERAKGLAIFNAVISTAQAVIGFLANPGGIPGVALSALAGTAGALQIAAIASQPLPTFQSGGIIPGTPSQTDNTFAVVRSGEEVITEDDPRHSINGDRSQLTVNMIWEPDIVAKTIVDDYINTGIYTINSRGLQQ